MEIGMLWFDDDGKRTLDEKVARAAEHYRTKYGAAPTVCFVNPTMLPKHAPELAAGMSVRPARNIMVNHFWIGVGDGALATGKNGNGARKK